MQRDYVEKLYTNPAWADAYKAALVRAEATGLPNGHADAIAYACTAADLVVADQVEQAAEAERAAMRASVRRAHPEACARLDAETAAARAAAAGPAPAAAAPAEDASALWSRTVARLNARRGSAPASGSGQKAEPVDEQVGTDVAEQMVDEVGGGEQDAAALAWSRVAQRINATR